MYNASTAKDGRDDWTKEWMKECVVIVITLEKIKVHLSGFCVCIESFTIVM